MRAPEHIHTPEDGRGLRDIFLNGKRIERVVFADTKKGKIRVLTYPLRIDRWKKRVLTKTLYGHVEVIAK